MDLLLLHLMWLKMRLIGIILPTLVNIIFNFIITLLLTNLLYLDLNNDSNNVAFNQPNSSVISTDAVSSSLKGMLKLNILQTLIFCSSGF